MLYWAAAFFVLAIMAALLGFGGILVGGAATLAQLACVLFLVLFVTAFFTGLFNLNYPRN